MTDKKIKIQIYQIRESHKRIRGEIFTELKKNYRIELHKITIEEIDEIINKKVHLLIFDSIDPKIIDSKIIDAIQANNKHLYTMFVGEKITEEIATNLFINNIDYICEGSFKNEYILSLLKSILKRKSKKYFIESVIKYKNIKIDSICHEIFIGSKLVETSKKEFKLIRFLVENNEDFLTKAEIFKSIWGYDEDVSRTLDQYLHRIKKKIGNEVLIVKDKSSRIKML
ncbi:winged helix-turn-helix domain-containing protein [Mycoplasma marinum]|uniref:OmpR/PhoB-type domain-containing protein n=1 Tax=Mycoplasma marinum TaxID=1937190 RepID=A0A4R0XMI5_9MOLU|nr:winged helix-turn-helix domain-containing protein [Mycoplasma marinum]TCG11747.1 hypothetical protein C4B24_01180 [Mycoplasma marinum]